MKYQDRADAYAVPVSASETKKMVAFAEKHGAILREQAGIGMYEVLDPFVLLKRLNGVALPFNNIEGSEADDQQIVSRLNGKTWSGMSDALPDGSPLILLNPDQTPERERVTVMEELAHIYLGHKKSQLATDDTDGRTYDSKNETEAYWTAAASLLPANVVGRAVWQGRTAAELAADYGVSVKLAEFRISILCLWSAYKKRGGLSMPSERDAA